MIYGYIRVSTDKQTTENQRYEILKYCSKNNLVIEEWIEETISATKALNKRLLGGLLSKKMVGGDILIASELSRLGRNLMQIMSILHDALNKDLMIITIKDNYKLGNDLQSKVLAFAFGLSAEIERNLISQRTKEALARRKAEGVILGRPKGRTSHKKLDDKIIEIQGYLDKRTSVSQIGRFLNAHRLTVTETIKRHGLKKQLI